MIWTSPHPPLAEDDATLPALVLEAAARQPGRRALVDGPSGEATSFAQLTERSERVALGLAAHSFGAGDTLALWAPNVPGWASLGLGALMAGGALTGVNPAAVERELVNQLADTRACLLATLPALAEPARAAAAAAGLAEPLVFDGAAADLERTLEVGPVARPTAEAPRARPPASKRTPGDRSHRAPALEPGSTALLPLSSGTTGLPKAVVLSHRNLAASVRQVSLALALGERDTVLAVAPFAHVMGFLVTLAAPLSVGATVVTLPRFQLDAALAIVARERVTVLVAPPPVLAALARQPDLGQHDLSSLELVVCGGAPLAPALQRTVAERLPNAAVAQAYGMTETAVGISGPTGRAPTPPGSVGRPMASTELRVVDPGTGRELGAGEVGELWVRGPQVMAGYLRRPEATAEILAPDGWLRTGDLGRVDADGNLYVVDRLKELIKVGALQVPPAELEALLVEHPSVADVAVVPRPDEARGELPVAMVVPRGELDRDALMRWVAERVAPHKRIRDVVPVERIPRSPAGKILRRELLSRARPAPPTARGDGSERRGERAWAPGV